MAGRIGEGLGERFQSALIPSVAQLLRRLHTGIKAPIRFHVRRPDDLLVFDLLFENLQVEPHQDRGSLLRRSDSTKRGILIVEFPPQSFGEEAFLGAPSPLKGKQEDALAERKKGPTINKVNETHIINNEVVIAPSPAEDPAPLVRIRMAGASRVAFVMDPAIDEIPFTLDAVLDAMRDWKMNLDSNAKADSPDTRFNFFLDKIVIKELREAVTKHVSIRANVDFDKTLAHAVQRITRESAGGLTESGQPQIGSVMWGGVLREAELLFGQNPELREGDLHFATIAILSLESAGLLSDTAQQLNIDFDQHQLFEKLPYITFLTGLPHEPSSSVTALELPYRLILSPIEDARWRHRIFPHVAQGVTELWHTRLTTTTGIEDIDAAAKVRAIWSPDYPLDDTQIAENVNRPFRMSLDTQDRKMLVNLMGNYRQRRSDVPRYNYVPRASTTKRLQLSALGGLLDLEGEWAIRPRGVDLEQWRHLATLGRDHYVRVVYSGFLLPFGHAASLVKVTERKFEGEINSRRAVLRQRFFIVVRERERSYDGSEHEFGGRNFPFAKIELLTRVTPDLAQPEKVFDENFPTITPRMAFWPKVPVASSLKFEFRFEATALDRNNQRVSFSLPMMFVSEIVNRDHNTPLREIYNKSKRGIYRETHMQGGSIRFDKNDDENVSTLSAHLMSFNLGDNLKNSTTKPNFHPQVERVEVGVPSLQKLLGRNELIVMQYPDVVIKGETNTGDVFLVVEENSPAELKFGGGGNGQQTDSLGGLAAPQMAIYGLSKLSGLIASKKGLTLADAIKKSVSNKFDPSEYFSPDATLIGGISLVDLFKGVSEIALNHADAPKFLSTETATHIETRFDWVTPITKSDGLNLLVPENGTRLTMSGQTRVPINYPQAAQRSAKALLEKFKLNLFGCIILHFDKLAFNANPGQKPDISVLLNQQDAVRFGGPLEFVNDLREFIPTNGFSDPPSLSVTPSGISASYSLALPIIGVGIFSLSNVTLGAAFNLPFDNRPISVRFNFAERERPFSLTVSLLGGGGFFAATVGSKGVQEIEAALEFGAAVSLALAVASGMVEIKAGVYFNWKSDAEGKRVVLAGYVRIHGELTIVAIFSASLTFNLQLAYENRDGQSLVYGEAELIVEVEVVFVSFSVPVRCRKEFGGGQADPKFLDLMDERSWTDYCAAFAPEKI